jgi:hypothetical protein
LNEPLRNKIGAEDKLWLAEDGDGDRSELGQIKVQRINGKKSSPSSE